MDSNLQARPQPVSQLRQTAGSNVFSKGVQSRLYQSFNLQTSSLHQNERTYDPQYRAGFPKLYSFDTSVQNKGRISLDQKGKYSFRNDYSKIVQQNSMLIQENTYLRQEISRLTTIIQSQRQNSGSRTEVERLSSILIQRDTEIRTLNERFFFLQSQTQTQGAQGTQINEWQTRFNQSQQRLNETQQRFNESQQRLNQSQQRFNESQNIISQLNAKITSLTQQVTQYESQFNQLNIRLTQYKTEITTLNTQINEYTTRISQLERQQKQPVQQRPDPQVDQLRYEISSLTTKIGQYQIQISQYERTFAQYESQITTLQQVNWKLEDKLTRQEATSNAFVQPTIVTVQNEGWLVEQGKLNFRIIILLEEINRLKQREHELLVKAEELHAYLLKAENYIEEIQQELQKNNLKENVPAHIVQKVTLLEQQNTRYTILIQELQSHLSTTQISGVSEDEHLARLGERDFRIIILLQEINRLNTKVSQTRQYLQRAEIYIEELQQTIQHQETVIPTEVQNQIRYLSQQNHRLNELVQKYIEDLKHYKVTIQAPSLPKIEYQVPHDVEVRLAFLAQENQRLTQLISELQRRIQLQPATVVETVIEYQTSPEIETRLGLLAQENERMTRHIIELERGQIVVSHPVPTSTVVQSEFARLQLQSIILLQEINRLNQAHQQTATYLINAQNFIQQLEIRLQQQTTTIQTRIEYAIPAQLQQQLANNTLQRMILFQQINRLNYLVKEVQSHLINAENYIEQCEVRLREHTNVQTVVEFQISPEIENRLAFLASENERLTQIINELQTRPARVETRVEQKVEFKIPAEIQNRIAMLAAENERLERALSSRPQPQADQPITAEQSKLQFRVIILLEEINRLNHVRQQLIQNLINAENYIFQLQSKPQVGIPPEIGQEILSLNQQNQQLLENISRISISYEQQISVYKTEISSINIQLSQTRSEANTYKFKFDELSRSSIVSSSSSHVEEEFQAKLAVLEFRVIILLEEINRLNHARQETLQNLINAESYIFEIENRVQQVAVSPQVEAEISSLRQQNQHLLQEISRLSITSTSSHNNQQMTVEQAKLQFRVIILLQQINRLNHKVSSVDKERLEVIGHLVNAEHFIQELEVKRNQLQQLSTKKQASEVVGSNSAIHELNAQLSELQYRGKLQIATKDFRVIILLEEINRLNHKIQSVRGSAGSSSESELYALQQGKEAAERELEDILGHLRQAEEYIGQLLRTSEGLTQQRDMLLHELNTVRQRV